MKLLRYFYIDELGLTSLHAQLTHGEVTESVTTTEHTNTDKKSLKLSFLSLIGAADMECAHAAKEAMTRKLRLRAGNMLREISASLRAAGELHTEFSAAAAKTRSSGEPAWFSGRHPKVQSWLKRHPRFHLHFTPTSSSWLNLVERWFREITRKRIRRGSFKSVKDLIEAIQEYIGHNNQNPKPFVWTKRVDQILEKVGHCKAATVTPH